MSEIAAVAAPELPSEQASGRRLLRRALRKPLGVTSAAYLVLLTLACVLAPLIAPYTPLAEDLVHVQQGRPARTCSAPTSSAGTCCPGCCSAAS
jgi:hypothetical protein